MQIWPQLRQCIMSRLQTICLCFSLLFSLLSKFLSKYYRWPYLCCWHLFILIYRIETPMFIINQLKEWIRPSIVPYKYFQSVHNNTIHGCCRTPVITSDFIHPGMLPWWWEADVSSKSWVSSTCTELRLVCITSERRLLTVRLCSGDAH